MPSFPLYISLATASAVILMQSKHPFNSEHCFYQCINQLKHWMKIAFVCGVLIKGFNNNYKVFSIAPKYAR